MSAFQHVWVHTSEALSCNHTGRIASVILCAGVHSDLFGQFKRSDGGRQMMRLFAQLLGGSGCLLDQSGILLSHVIHLRYGPINLCDSGTLFD